MLRTFASRSASLKSFVRCYSGAPSSFSVDIDALLERVKVASTKSANNQTVGGKMLNNARKRFNNGRQNNNRPQKQGEQLSASQGKTFSKPKPARNNNNINKNNAEIGDAFTEISSSFSVQQPIRNNNNRAPRNITRTPRAPRNNNNNNKNNNGSLMSPNLRSKSQQKPNRRPNTTRPVRSSSQTSSAIINHNFEKIQTAYTPEIPSVDSLFADAQLTSQTPTSRILKAYQILQVNPNADVSTVLTGKASVLPNDVISKMKTNDLKLNATSVINSLNNNRSLPLDVKEKLVGPLVGLEPVKALSA